MKSRIWLDSELIVWKCETRDEIRTKHPDWSRREVDDCILSLANTLLKRGQISKEQLNAFF